MEARRSRPTTGNWAWEQFRSATAPTSSGGSDAQTHASFPAQHPKGSSGWKSLGSGGFSVLTFSPAS